MKLEYYIIQVIINKLLHIQIGEDNTRLRKKTTTFIYYRLVFCSAI